MPPDPRQLLEPLHMGPHEMPGMWRHILPEDLQWLEVPTERHSTCADCHMLQCGESTTSAWCCSHFPEIANFMIGLGLQAEPEAALAPLIAGRHTLPLGLVASPWRYRKSLAGDVAVPDAPQSPLRCPLLDPSDDGCRAYSIRNSVCSTYFCRNDHGRAGNEFWGRMQDLVGQVEAALSQWCMDQIGLDHATYCAILDSESADVAGMSDATSLAWSERSYNALWGPWRGQEQQFFVACAQLAREHSNHLFEIAKTQAGRDPLIYEQNLQQFLPEQLRDLADPPAYENSQFRPIDDALQLLRASEKRLWALPFCEAPVQLSDDIEIVENPRDDQWTRFIADSHMIRRRIGSRRITAIREPVNAAQVRALKLFESPRQFGEELFEEPAIVDQKVPVRSFRNACDSVYCARSRAGHHDRQLPSSRLCTKSMLRLETRPIAQPGVHLEHRST